MKKKSALIVSVAMVLVAVLALTTASFAWFTNSMNPSIGEFDVQVTSANALLVGVKETQAGEIKDIPFKTSLTLDDLKKGYGNKLLAPEADGASYKLKEVTPELQSVDGSNKAVKLTDGKIKFQELKYPDKPFDYVDPAGVTANNNSYVDFVDKVEGADANKVTTTSNVFFDMYFKASFSEMESIDVYLDIFNSLSRFYTVKEDTANPGQYIAMAASDSLKYYLPASLRVAFVAQEVIKKDGTANIGVPTAATVVEPFTSSVPNNISAYVDEKRQPKADYTVATMASDAAKDTVLPKDAAGQAITLSDNVPGLKLFSMDNGSIVRLGVYIWVEGNDPQCESSISGSFFRSVFNFRGVETPAPPAP